MLDLPSPPVALSISQAQVSSPSRFNVVTAHRLHPASASGSVLAQLHHNLLSKHSAAVRIDTGPYPARPLHLYRVAARLHLSRRFHPNRHPLALISNCFFNNLALHPTSIISTILNSKPYIPQSPTCNSEALSLHSASGPFVSHPTSSPPLCVQLPPP